jgi:fibronectin-binding autotransporter adhesin
MLLVRGPNLGGSGPDSSRLTFASPPLTAGGLIPGVLGDFDPVAGAGSFLVRYDPVQGVVPVNPAAATPVIQNAAPTNTPTTADVLVGTTVTRDAANTVNSLTFAPGAALSADTPPSSTLTLTSGSLFVRPGGSAGVTGVTLAAGAGAPFTAITYSDLTAGPLTAGAGLTKAGPGNLTLTGPATITGGLQVLAGTLTFNADATAGSLNGSGGVTIGPGATLTLSSSGIDSFTGPLAGAGNLLRTAAATGTQTLAAVNSTGDIETRAGTLRITGPVGPAAGSRLILGDSALSSVAATLTLSPGLTIDRDLIVTASNAAATSVVRTVNVSAQGSPVTFTGPVTLNRALQVTTPVGNSPTRPSVTFANTVSGPGQLILGNANVNLSVTNTFTGGVALASGSSITAALGVGADGSLGTGTLSVTVAGLLRADNGPRTLANPVQFAGGSYLGLIGSNSLALTGPADLNGGQRSIENAALGTVFTLGDVTGAGSSNLLVNQGGAQLFASHAPVRLAGTGSYAGTTTVVTGPFLVDGTLTGSTSAVTVNSGATLGGTGTISRPVSVNGTLAPGDSPGILNVTAPVTLNSGSVFAVELNGPTPGNGPNNHDQLNLTGGGSVNLGGATLTVTLSNGYVPANMTSGDTLTIITGGPVSGTFANGNSIVINGFYPATIQYGSNSVVLQFQPVPEPAHALLFAAGAAGLWRLRRRRRAAV